ncbi:hypothetical protein [Persephonella sp.]
MQEKRFREYAMELLYQLYISFLSFIERGILVFEPYQGSVSMDEKQYSAMQGIIHAIGWTLIIIILVVIFRYMKKHTQQDERMKKYYSEENKETQTNQENQQ